MGNSRLAVPLPGDPPQLQPAGGFGGPCQGPPHTWVSRFSAIDEQKPQHLGSPPQKNLDHHQPGKWKDKIFFLNCPDPGPATAETVPVRRGLSRFAEAGRHSLTYGAGSQYLGHL